MPYSFLADYFCRSCDCRIWFEYGEWGCECWAVGDKDLADGEADIPLCWAKKKLFSQEYTEKRCGICGLSLRKITWLNGRVETWQCPKAFYDDYSGGLKHVG